METSSEFSQHICSALTNCSVASYNVPIDSDRFLIDKNVFANYAVKDTQVIVNGEVEYVLGIIDYLCPKCRMRSSFIDRNYRRAVSLNCPCDNISIFIPNRLDSNTAVTSMVSDVVRICRLKNNDDVSFSLFIYSDKV